MERLIAKGIIDTSEQGAVLVGERCTSCGIISFPPRGFCTHCLCEEMIAVPLSKRGTLYSYTVARMPTTHFHPPKGMGYIDLPEGVRVFAPLEDREDYSYEIGEELEFELCPLWTENKDSEDIVVIGYQFRTPTCDK